MANMSIAASLPTRDVYQLMRLSNELHELAPNPIARHEHMLSTLCAMTGARVAVSAMIDFAAPSQKPALMFVTYVGLCGHASLEAANRYLRTLDPPDPVWRPLLKILQAKGQRPTTLLRHQILDNGQWYRSTHYDAVRRPAEIDHALYSVCPLPQQNRMTALILNRSRNERQPFSMRDRRLVRMLHATIPWLFRPPQAPAEQRLTAGELSPRERQTLRHLLSGDSEKQIAAKIGLSPHTVHIYVKALYRSYNVSTRGELLSRFVHPERG
jgi:DNA-binding CsgD family transcriptional regulator